MTGPGRLGGSVIPWLIAQSFVFGLVAALLGIVANAIFLDAYGAGWLPVTYIAIGVAGVVVSGAVARSARSAAMIRIALAVLGGATVILLVSWLIAATVDAPWVSIPLLVLFPILIQLGFVFIGGQAGRLLDIAGIKASFPRIMAGFPIGAIVGGLLGGALVGVTGRVEDLLLATAIAQGAFAGLVWATGRRFVAQLAPVQAGAESLGPPPPAAEGGARPSLGALLARRFVALILGYQVLSALGSQLADFLVYDRAAAQYPDPADLAGFLSGYTSVMNVVSIAFLAVLAGPLLRRFGLRLGITANPLVLTVFAVAMIATLVVDGAASLSLLMVVSAARIADIALTDGTTRTSINATYQVLAERDRLAVQAVVEGIGVPVAIGISGVLILVLNALPSALAATIVVTAVTCLVWSGAAVLLVQAYGPALVERTPTSTMARRRRGPRGDRRGRGACPRPAREPRPAGDAPGCRPPGQPRSGDGRPICARSPTIRERTCGWVPSLDSPWPATPLRGSGSVRRFAPRPPRRIRRTGSEPPARWNGSTAVTAKRPAHFSSMRTWRSAAPPSRPSSTAMRSQSALSSPRSGTRRRSVPRSELRSSSGMHSFRGSRRGSTTGAGPQDRTWCGWCAR